MFLRQAVHDAPSLVADGRRHRSGITNTQLARLWASLKIATASTGALGHVVREWIVNASYPVTPNDLSHEHLLVISSLRASEYVFENVR